VAISPKGIKGDFFATTTNPNNCHLQSRSVITGRIVSRLANLGLPENRF